MNKKWIYEQAKFKYLEILLWFAKICLNVAHTMSELSSVFTDEATRRMNVVPQKKVYPLEKEPGLVYDFSLFMNMSEDGLRRAIDLYNLGYMRRSHMRILEAIERMSED